MEVRIRLQKASQKASKRYNYRVVAISRSNARQGKHLELLGYYDPSKNPAVFKLDQEKINKWLKCGAVLSNTVRSLLNKSKKAQN
jgi:small subunit ribosomal protein S16